MWDEMPEILRLRALLLVDDTDKFIETYDLPCELIATRDHWSVSHNTYRLFYVRLVVRMPRFCAATHRSERPTREESCRRSRNSRSRDLPDVSVL